MKTMDGIASVLRRYFVGALATGLVACNAPLDSALESGASYRDQETLIGVTSRFEESRFVGLWHLRAYLPASERYDQLAFGLDGTTPKVSLAANVCDAAGICGFFAEDLNAKRVGNGHYLIDTLNGTKRKMWVLWVDEGFRTAVIGNPEGTFAWILDRSATGGADRIKAAREILDFNGYDVSQLKVQK